MSNLSRSRASGLLVFVLALFMAAELVAGPEDGRPATIPTFEKTGVRERQLVERLQIVSLEGKPFALASAWADKPALIVLSSISCPVSRDNCAAVDRLAQVYADKINVVVIYTIDAHPVGSPSPYSDREWLTARNVRDEILVKQPDTLAQRIALAKEYQQLKGIKATLVVDAMDNRAWKHIGPGPNTAILVNANGEVVQRQGWLEPAGMEGAMRWQIALRENEKLKEVANKLSEKLNPGIYPTVPRLDEQKDFEHVDRVLKKAPELVNLMAGQEKGETFGDTMLHKAANGGNDRAVAFLLERKANVDAVNSEGRTPLHMAAKSNRAGAVKSLLAAKADPNAVDNLGLTPMHLALLAGHVQITRQLLDAGGAMDLRIAAGLGDMPQIKRYLDLYRQTDIYLKVRGGAALAFAAATGQEEAINLLLDEHVLTDASVDGDPPVYFAIVNAQHKAVELLLQRKVNADISMGSYSGGPLHHAAYKNDAVLVKLLAQHGADLEKLDYDERTPLHEAAMYGSAKAVQALLEAGAKIDARTGREGQYPCGPMIIDGRPVLDTPLHLAVRRQQVEVVELLLKHGASTELTNRDRETPLAVANRVMNGEPTDAMTRIKQLLLSARPKR